MKFNSLLLFVSDTETFERHLDNLALLENNFFTKFQTVLSKETWRLMEKDGKATLESNEEFKDNLVRIFIDSWVESIVSGSKDCISEIQSIFDQRSFTGPTVGLAIDKSQIINSAAAKSIEERALNLVGDYSEDHLKLVKNDILSAINPDKNGVVLSRKELITKLQGTLKVSENRASIIAQTETTTAYNQGRVTTALQSRYVTHMRFLAIKDSRTTLICQSRHNMLIPITDVQAIANNTPALHVRCRSVLSPVMGTINASHKKWIDDPSMDYLNRTLEPIPDGWRGSKLTLPVGPGERLKSLAPLQNPTMANFIERGSEVTKLFINPAEVREKIVEFRVKHIEIRDKIKPGLTTRQLANIEKKLDNFEKEFTAYTDSVFTPFRQELIKSGLEKSKVDKLWKNLEIDNVVDSNPILNESYQELMAMSNGKAASVKRFDIDPQTLRPYAWKSNQAIHLSPSSDKQTIFHEMGHFVEFESQSLKRAANDFIHKRASGAPRKLNDILNTNVYTPDEIALPDRFINPYVGKIYDSEFTEVWSVGIEHLADSQSMASLFYYDEEHFNLTLGGLL